MKVLHVEGGRHFYGGARQVVYLIEGLAARGVAGLLACPPHARIVEYAAPSATVLPTSMRGDADVAMAWRLAAHIRRHEPDIVHLHSRRGVDVWGAFAARACRVRCVLSRRVDNREPRAWASLKYRLYDHVIAISEGIRDVLLEEGVDPDRVSCVRSALDAQPWLHDVDPRAFRREFDLPENALVIATVAQLIPRKGHRYLLEAAETLRHAFPDMRVVLFGQGPLRATLESEVAARGLSPIVRFAGFRDDLARWLGGVDILAHPADIEGLGIALLQAQAAAVPVVASRAGGMPEAVADGISGRLVEPGDVAGLTEALRALLADPELRRRMGEAGRARIRQEFSVDAMVEGNLAVYHRVLRERTGPAAREGTRR